jgi:hypothetical protein
VKEKDNQLAVTPRTIVGNTAMYNQEAKKQEEKESMYKKALTKGNRKLATKSKSTHGSRLS